MRSSAPLALSLALLAIGRAPAQAEAGDLELALTSEALVFVSDTVAATTDSSLGFTPGLRLGYALTDCLAVMVGWRDLASLNRSDRGYDLTTSGDAVVLAARYSFGLHPSFDLHLELDLEALHSNYQLDLADRTGATSSWGVGLVPKVVASAAFDIDPLQFELRLMGGFALRTDQHADGLRLGSAASAAEVAPLDLGLVNLSGFVFGGSLALIF